MFCMACCTATAEQQSLSVSKVHDSLITAVWGTRIGKASAWATVNPDVLTVQAKTTVKPIQANCSEAIKSL